MDKRASWCIVALPEESSPVNEISSEKAAHMTLLFLGEQDDPELAVQIYETLHHTLKTSFPHKFSLGVNRRGVLGDDEADVLFFDKNEASRAEALRQLLLKNDDIRKCYDSVDQYPFWTPHLTLGYPEKPANPLPDHADQTHWVLFDRIALWIEDSDGPTVTLGRFDDDSYERHYDIPASATSTINQSDESKGLSMNDIQTDDFLAHYGVKGMKWGKRKRAALQDRADSLNRVAKGKSTITDKIVATNTLSALDVARGKGVKGGAAIKAKQYEKAVAKLDAKAARKSEKAAKGKAAANKHSQRNGKRRIDTISNEEAVAEVEAWLKEQGL